MKNLIAAMLLMVIAITTAGCGTSGDDAGKISVITREDGSGTRGAFVEIVGLVENKVDQTTIDAIVHDGTGKVMIAVKNDKNAIGYISLGSLNSTVKAVSINGILPTNENIKNTSYKVSRPFNIVMKQDISPITTDFINYITSLQGQEIVNENGYINIASNHEFKSMLHDGTIVIGGSTSVYPLMEKLAEEYKIINPNAVINIEAIGSSAGIKGAIDGTFDLGMASRELKAAEKAKISHLAIALDGIAIIVNNENPLNDLTITQLQGIYKDTITSFNEIK